MGFWGFGVIKEQYSGLFCTTQINQSGLEWIGAKELNEPDWCFFNILWPLLLDDKVSHIILSSIVFGWSIKELMGPEEDDDDGKIDGKISPQPLTSPSALFSSYIWNRLVRCWYWSRQQFVEVIPLAYFFNSICKRYIVISLVKSSIQLFLVFWCILIIGFYPHYEYTRD